MLRVTISILAYAFEIYSIYYNRYSVCCRLCKQTGDIKTGEKKKTPTDRNLKKRENKNESSLARLYEVNLWKISDVKLIKTVISALFSTPTLFFFFYGTSSYQFFFFALHEMFARTNDISLINGMTVWRSFQYRNKFENNLRLNCLTINNFCSVKGVCDGSMRMNVFFFFLSPAVTIVPSPFSE